MYNFRVRTLQNKNICLLLIRSVDMVLVKIKLLLQNGTMHIQDRLVELQGQLDHLKKSSENEVQ
jgi:hypothetical protein